MNHKPPEKLFACFCKRKQPAAVKPANAPAGSHPSGLDPERAAHLRYSYGLAEKGITWAGGPLADSRGTLTIYAVNREEEARKAKRNDPYYFNGLFYDDIYYQWFIHVPLNLASPEHRDMLDAGLRRAGISPILRSPGKDKNPERLFVCFSRMKPLQKGTGEIVREHFRYQFGYLDKQGLIWAAGPLDNYEACLQVFMASSMEQAKKAVQEDPFTISGIFYDNEFYEWFIHMPLDKASALHRPGLEHALLKIGITPNAGTIS